jgi:hypothetical protein
MAKTFTQFMNEQEERVNDTRSTQVATTAGTYKKTGEFLKDKLAPNSKILNVGAGLDTTREGLHAGLGENSGHTVHDMEPNPERRKVAPEYTEAHQIPHNKYHAVVCHNVLNVVEPHIREHVMNSLFNSVKEGGHIVIGTRKWSGDINQNRNFEPGHEPKSMWVKKKGSESYQKGFDGDELKRYVEDFAKRTGHQVEVTKVPLAANGVHVRLIKKG